MIRSLTKISVDIFSIFTTQINPDIFSGKNIQKNADFFCAVKIEKKIFRRKKIRTNNPDFVLDVFRWTQLLFQFMLKLSININFQ